MNTSHVLNVSAGLVSVIEVNYSYTKERLKLQQFLLAATASRWGRDPQVSGGGWMDYRHILNTIISITVKVRQGQQQGLRD